MCPASRSEAKLLTTAVLISVILSSGFPRPASAQDEWFAPDKLLHFLGGFLVTSVTYTVALNAFDNDHEDARLYALAAGMAASIAKEAYDGLSGTGTPSGKDLVWDGMGIGFSLVLINQLVERRSDPVGPALATFLEMHGPRPAAITPANGQWSISLMERVNRIDTPTLPLSLTFLRTRPPGD
jgi:uncharacterized protein YfiM (DUF2279 family)